MDLPQLVTYQSFSHTGKRSIPLTAVLQGALARQKPTTGGPERLPHTLHTTRRVFTHLHSRDPTSLHCMLGERWSEPRVRWR
jgi:hypothetical protein